MNEQEKARKTKYAELQTQITAEPTPRHWALYRLMLENLNGLTMKEICDKCEYTDGTTHEKVKAYTYNDSPQAQKNHCPQFYADRTFINANERFDKIIIRDGELWMFADEKQAKEQYEECLERANYYHAIQGALARKIQKNGLGKLFSNDLKPIDDDSKAEPFHKTLVTDDDRNNARAEVNINGVK